MKCSFLVLCLAAAACGSSSKPAARPSEPEAPPIDPNLLDIGDLPPLPQGFRYYAELSQFGYTSSIPASEQGEPSNLSTSVAIKYGLALLELTGGQASKVQLDVRSLERSTNDAVEPTKLAGQSYLLSATEANRADGTPATPEELGEIAALAEAGIFTLPVRDALVGLRLEKDKPLALTLDQLAALIFQQPIPDTEVLVNELTFHGTDASGIASLAVVVKAESTDKTVTWTAEATITVEAATLLPQSITVKTAAMVAAPSPDILYLSGTQTFTWKFTYPA